MKSMGSTVVGEIREKTSAQNHIQSGPEASHDDVSPQYGQSSHVWDGFPYTRRLLIHGNASDMWEDWPQIESRLMYGRTSHIGDTSSRYLLGLRARLGLPNFGPTLQAAVPHLGAFGFGPSHVWEAFPVYGKCGHTWEVLE